MAGAKRKNRVDASVGRLRIGDDWNAITIIALSQTNPLKALAEFVENSIDAGAGHITITRGKEKGEPYLSIIDDGEGIPKNAEGIPDFKYVATHICDSVKKRMKDKGEKGVQGEFGIGLLSFWTLGEQLTLTSTASDGQTYQMTMRKGDTDYRVVKRRTMFPAQGTELRLKPLLSGIRQLSGEKIQWYLASELRDRIRNNNIELKVIDRTARKEFKVEPREFDGRLIHSLPPAKTSAGEIYLELYLADPNPSRKVGLYRNGTRVLESVTGFEGLKESVWASGYLEGIIDIPFLNITPGTRLGLIQDHQFARAWFALRPIEDHLETLIKEVAKAEAERASRHVLKSIQKAFREALLALPAEEYDWFDASLTRERKRAGNGESNTIASDSERQPSENFEPEQIQAGAEPTKQQRDFFDYAGPLSKVMISPASSVIAVGQARNFRAITRDKRHRTVDHDLKYEWEILAGNLALSSTDNEIVTVTAGAEPGLGKLGLTVHQGDTSCQGEAIVTITDSLDSVSKTSTTPQSGLPGYTYLHAAGELWRSRYDEDQNVITINNGHRDFVYSSKSKALKLRYITRLFAKEMVLKNFQGLAADQLLERMIELSLYTEENLR